MLVLTVAALPVAAVVAWGLARRRRAAGAARARAWCTALLDVAVVHGTVPWVWMILLPGSRAGTVLGRAQLVPLADPPTLRPGPHPPAATGPRGRGA